MRAARAESESVEAVTHAATAGEHVSRQNAPNARITVSLVKRAAEDLKQLHESTGLSQTDIVNRALSMYAFIEAELQSGSELIIRDSKTGGDKIVRFL